MKPSLSEKLSRFKPGLLYAQAAFGSPLVSYYNHYSYERLGD